MLRPCEAGAPAIVIRRLAAWFGKADHRQGTHHQQLAQPFVACLTDPEQTVLAAGRMLSGHQPQPSSEVTPTLEIYRVCREGHGDRAGRAKARDRGQALADRVRLVLLNELLAHDFDLRIEIRDMLPDLGEHALSHCGNGRIIYQNSKPSRDIAAAFGHHDPESRRMRLWPGFADHPASHGASR